MPPAPPTVALIPARGGSKRVPRKNVRLLDGRPLISWVIETARISGAFDRVIVSTDDDEIAALASEAGAEVPYRRGSTLSDDHTPLVPVVADAIYRLALSPEHNVCCLYPTAVGLLPADLAGASLKAAEGLDGRYLVSVARYSHPIQRALRLGGGGTWEMSDASSALVRTQDLEPHWFDAGQFVWGAASTWAAGLPVLTHAIGFEIPAWRAVDLDTEDDWRRAEVVHGMIRDDALG